MTIYMAAKHHCLICGILIYSGLYCSGCTREIIRARTYDDESFEEWLARNREFRLRAEELYSERNTMLEMYVDSQTEVY